MNGNKILLSRRGTQSPFYVIKDYLEMAKIHLCLYIGLSAVFGHVTACRNFSAESFFLGGLVFILACGSAVLNNVQDRNYDAFFPRTCRRPLPEKRVPVLNAVILALLMIGFGLSGLLLVYDFSAFFWGTVAVTCYNGVYTPLKKISLLAIFPGSLSGMLPPLIGWTGAGNSLFDTDILVILSIFGIWQIPHFFISLLKTRQALPGTSGSVTSAFRRFPSFTQLFSQNEIRLQILIWTSLYSLGVLLFAMKGVIKSPGLSVVCGLNAGIITILVSILVFKTGKRNIPQAFLSINLSMLFFIGAGICDMCCR